MKTRTNKAILGDIRFASMAISEVKSEAHRRMIKAELSTARRFLRLGLKDSAEVALDTAQGWLMQTRKNEES